MKPPIDAGLIQSNVYRAANCKEYKEKIFIQEAGKKKRRVSEDILKLGLLWKTRTY